LRQVLLVHSDRLSSYLGRHLPVELRGLIEPQDVLQDTFFEAFQRLPEFVADEDDAAYRWLLTIARHRLIDLIRGYRSAKRGGAARKFSMEEFRHSSVVVLLQDLAVYNRTPSQSASRREVVAMVEHSLHMLKIDYREAVRLRYLEGLSLKDTAMRMKRTEDSAQKLCERALAALRAEMRTASRYL